LTSVIQSLDDFSVFRQGSFGQAKGAAIRVLLIFLETIYDMLQRFMGEVAQLPGAIEDALGFHTRMTEAIATRDSDRTEQEMILYLFDVVRRIESNLKIDLQQNTLYGFNLIHRKTQARRFERK
jgi:hypothetical protein